MAVIAAPKCPPAEPAKSRDAIIGTGTSQVGADVETKVSWFHLFAFVRRQHIGLLLSAVAAAMAVAGAKTVYAIIMGKIFDIVSRFGIGRLNGDDTLAGVSTWCVVLTTVGVAIWVANAGFMALWIIFGEVCAKSARDTIFTAMLRKDMGWFDAQGDGLSSMLVRIQGQTRELQTATSQVLGYLVCDIFISIACLVVAFYYSWKLSLVLLATIPLSVLALNLISRPLEPAIEEQKLALSRGSKLANAAVSAIDLVKVYNGSDQEVWQYIQAIRQAMKHYLTQARCNCLQMSYIKFWMINLFVVGFWFAVYLVDRGETTPGKALTTFYAALTAFEAIESVGPQWLVLAKGMSAGQSLHAIAVDLQRGRRIRRLEGRMRPKMCSGDIEVNDVTFTYPSNPTRTVLTQASFFFPAGEMSFLVGKSGSGKSTIGNLLLKFYEPQKGQILVDGQPLQTLDAGWVRSNITLIQQSSILFNDTLFMNVAFGHPDPEHVSKEEVKAACEAALLQSTIAGLPDGYNTMLGPGGYNLSGGQKQRLALARARLRDPPVLILDEVTSGLDPVSKTLIMDAIRVWRRGKTTIIVTHDVSQIQDQDYVYVLDQSFLVQEGFRRDLVSQQSGTFATLLASAGEDCDSPVPSSPLIHNYWGYGPDPGTYGAPASTMFGFLDDNIHMNHRPFHRLSLGMATAQMAGFRTQRARSSSYITETTDSTRVPGFRHASRRMSTIDSVGSSGNITKPGYRTSGETWKKSARSSIEVLQDMGDAIRAGRSQSTKDRKWFRVPAPGSQMARRSLQMSTGELQPHASTHIRREEPQLHIARIIGTVWPILDTQSRLLLMLGLGFCLVVAACNPAFAFVFAKLLQAFWAEGNRVATGQKWAIFLTIIAAVDATSVYFAHYFMERTAQTWVNNQRTEALKRVLSQPRSWFDKPSHSAGRIVECLDRNAEEMRNIVGRFVPIIIMVAVMVSAALIWALAISWKLTLVALCAGPAVYMATWTSSKVSDKWESLSNAGAQSSSVIFNEVFTNIRVVRALTLEPLFMAKHLRSTGSTFRLGVKRGLYTGIFYGLYQSMSFWLTALVFWYGTVLLRQHDHGIKVADIMQVINLLLFSMGTATMMLGSIPQISQAKTSATQLLYYASLDYHGSHEDRGRRRAMTPFPVRMNQLRFAYPGSSQSMALRNIDLQIDAGDFIAIAGASGSGKSTIASILLQLYEPSLPPWKSRNDIYGSHRYHNETKCNAPLTFAHVPSSELDTAVLRNMMAYVPQQPFLFPASIRDNIVYGLHEDSPLRDLSNVRRAAQAAGIHDFITSLPDGYQTLVGDGGLSISGGQTQRISIARALARKPKLLVLDEPTSALDAESAEGVRNTIKQLMAQAGTGGRDDLYSALDNRMAVVMITHSKESMMMADRIVVIDGGCAVEDGAYNDLVARNGKFAELVSGGVWMKQGRQHEKINNDGMKPLRTGDKGAGFADGWSGSDIDPNDSTAVEEDEDDTSRSALMIAAARAETMEALERPRSAVVRWHRGTPGWNDR